MKRIVLVLVVLIGVNIGFVFGQNNVGIGTTTPDASALLELNSNSLGLLITRVTLTNVLDGTSPVNAPATGLLVYNSAGALTLGFYYWDGGEWVLVGAGSGGGCTTLDEGYDCGGAGAGRAITADNGAVEVTLPVAGTSNAALDVYSNKAATWAIGAENTVTGVAVLGDVTGTANQYNAIQGSSFSDYNSGGTGIGSGGVAGFYEGSGDGVGVYGQVVDVASSGVAGIFGLNSRTSGGYGVNGQGYAGVVGEGVVTTIAGFGVFGSTSQGVGVQGMTDDLTHSGVVGYNNGLVNSGSGAGILGDGNTGVKGQTVYGLGYGVIGINQSTSTVDNNIGVSGEGWVGVYGKSSDGTGYGVYSDGEMGSSGTKSFVIDHPLDPENKNLKHFCMESPEVLNLYRGNIILDANGEAIVELPDYFESINKNFSYNLTPIGAPVNLYIKKKIENGQFEIAGGEPNMEVSWTVYAERNDKYLQAYPGSKQVEVDKRQPGKYIRPELFGQPQEKAAFPKNDRQEILKLEGGNNNTPRANKPFRQESNK